MKLVDDEITNKSSVENLFRKKKRFVLLNQD